MAPDDTRDEDAADEEDADMPHPAEEEFSHDHHDTELSDERITRTDTFYIENEFAQVKVSRIETPKGNRLEIVSPKTGSGIRLDSMALEGLAFQEPEMFSELLEDPFG
jgi:hypothetical protein